jgi:O-antigen/teichoic acid export membrane protein
VTDPGPHPQRGDEPTPPQTDHPQGAPSPAPDPPLDLAPNSNPSEFPIATEGSGSDEPSARGRASTGRIARAFGIQMFARIVGLLASVVTVALTTRHLGPTSYGHLTTAIVFVGLWTSFTELGIGSVIVRRVTSGSGDLNHLVRVNAGLSLVYCIPLAVITVVTGWAMYGGESEVVGMIAIVGFSLILTTLSSCVQPVFMTDVRFGAVAASDALGRILSLVGTIVLIYEDAPLVWFAAVQLIPPLVALLIQGVAAHRISNLRPVFSARDSWLLVRESLPQTGVLIIAALYWRSDGVLLSKLSTPDQVGAYGLAYSITFNATVISSTFLASALSTMTNLYASDKPAFVAFTTRSVQAMLFMGAPMAVVGMILSPELVHLMSSEEFVDAAGLMLGLLFVCVAIRFVNAVLSQALFAAHDQVFLLRLNVINLIANIALNLALIPLLGATGVGISLIASELIGLVVATWRLGRRSTYRTPWRFSIHLAVPLAAAAGVCILLRELPVLLTGLAAAVVYLAVNALLGPVRPSAVRGMLSRSPDGDSPEPTTTSSTAPEGSTS